MLKSMRRSVAKTKQSDTFEVVGRHRGQMSEFGALTFFIETPCNCDNSLIIKRQNILSSGF